MSLKKIKTTSTETFEQQVSEKVNITFTKVVTANNTTIYGKITKDGADAGNVSYDKNTDHVTMQAKPFSSFTTEEVTALYTAIPECINELTAE